MTQNFFLNTHNWVRDNLALHFSVDHMSESIMIYVCIPSKCIKCLSARSSDECSVLQGLLPGKKVCFIHHGALLRMDHTLEYYGVKDGDTIIAVVELPQSSVLPSLVDRWLTLTRTSDSFSDRVRSLMTPTSRRESLRLRDLAMLRAENSRTRNRRLVRRFFERSYREDEQAENSVIAENSAELSAEPLPKCWWFGTPGLRRRDSVNHG
jgi:hypothetical protein